jgi:hypothetical protein
VRLEETVVNEESFGGKFECFLGSGKVGRFENLECAMVLTELGVVCFDFRLEFVAGRVVAPGRDAYSV